MYTNVSRSGSSSTTTPQQQPKIYLQNQLTLSKPSSEEMERPGTRRGGRPGSQSTTAAEEDKNTNNIQQKFVTNINVRQPVVDVWTRDQSSRNSEFVIASSSSSNSSSANHRRNVSGTPSASSSHHAGNVSVSPSTKGQNGYPELSDPDRYSSEQFDESEEEDREKNEEKKEETDEEYTKSKKEGEDEFSKRLRDLAILRIRSLHESIRSDIKNEITNNKTTVIPKDNLSRRSSENSKEKDVKNIAINDQNSQPSTRKNSSEKSFINQHFTTTNTLEKHSKLQNNKIVLKSFVSSSSSSNLSLSQPPQISLNSKSSLETESEVQELQKQLKDKENNKSINFEKDKLIKQNSKTFEQRRASQKIKQKSEEGESIIFPQKVSLGFGSSSERFCLLSVNGRQRSNNQSKTDYNIRQRSSSVVRKEEHSETYKAWLKQKQNEEKAKKEKEKAEKNASEQQKIEKRELAAKNFIRWKSELDKRLAEKKTSERLKIEEKAKKEKQKKEEKLKESKQIFKSWTKQDIQQRKEQKERARSAEQRISKQNEQIKEQKRREAEAAFNAWIQMTDERIRNRNALKKEEEERKELERREQNEAKARIAEEAYSLWMNMKDEERKYRRSLAFRILDFERRANSERSITPWIPTSPTVIHSTYSRSTLLTPITNSAKGRRKTLEKKLVLPDWRKHQKNKNNFETKSEINSNTNKRPWR